MDKLGQISGALALIIALLLGAVGALGSYLFLKLRGLGGIKELETRADNVLAEAKEKKQQMLLVAADEAMKARVAIESEAKERRAEFQRSENRLQQKEQTLERKLDGLERRETGLSQKEKELEDLKAEVRSVKDSQVKQLEKISGMSSEEAKALLVQTVEKEIQTEASRRLREWEARIKEEANERAQAVLTTVMQRCATDVVPEMTVSVVPLPTEEMKGRLIGREGRNIRALEQATGVDLIIDDTPEAVTLSSFDGVRREIARVALNKLMLDGRIHPARIEEVVGKAKAEVEATIRTEGEQAAYKAGVQGLHPELVKLLGRLKFRTSYGQNVLMHSLEVAHLSGMIAGELGYDIRLAKKAGLLHDLGKAVDHEVEGSHASLGAAIVKQWEKSPEVSQAVGEHHGEAASTSTLGYIVSSADAISGGRPGARRESVEQYIKRLEAVESVAKAFSGVEKAFAIQAGREVRILVKPEEIDDLGAMRLARDIVKKLEETLEYPGQIKVTVIRETRAVDYAK
ncbi:MAG: ribonuclease Y [Chloroflexi bacterium]|nr:ribonuclease Y [Chloroflexota bacterium]